MKNPLGVPFFTQLDNANNPYGSCNVTCVAMVMAYFGIKGPGGGHQLEDYLYQAMLKRAWSRHSPADLQKVINTYPFGSPAPMLCGSFTERGTFGKIKASIDAGRPCILHGFFTRDGHIIVVDGYDQKGLIVNDPYGEYFAQGYNRAKSGKGLRYSYQLIARVCSPESPTLEAGNIWTHSIWKAPSAAPSVAAVPAAASKKQLVAA